MSQCLEIVFESAAPLVPEMLTDLVGLCNAIYAEVTELAFCFAPCRQQPDRIEQR